MTGRQIWQRASARVRSALLLTAAGVLLMAGSGVAPLRAHAAGACWDSVRSDLDGGGPDIVVGLPSFDLPGKQDAGAIVIYSGVAAQGSPDPRAPVARTLVTADDIPGLSAAAGARFGTSPVIWNDGPDDPDRCADLLVGAPGQQVGTRPGAGRVHLIHGSTSGLDRVLHSFDESSLGVPGGAQSGAAFGSALAAETSSMIAVGVPGRDVGGAVDAGRVVRLDYLSGGDPEVTVVEQGRSGAGGAERGDRFGEVLSIFGTGEGPIVIIGVPREDVGSRADAGAVAAMPLRGPLSMVTQDSPSAAGTAEAGDRYGAAVDPYCTFDIDHPVCVLAVGVPGEDVGTKSDAGMVSFAAVDLYLPGRPVSPIRGWGSTITQDSPGVPGSVEAGDAFGASIATAEFGSDAGDTQLVVGAPGEDLGGARDAGLVSVTRIDPVTGSPSPGTQAGGWSQDTSGVGGAAETGDRFGTSLAGVQLSQPVDDDDVSWAVILAIVPGEDLGSVADAGMAHLGLPGSDTISLVPPVSQRAAGTGAQPQRMLLG